MLRVRVQLDPFNIIPMYPYPCCKKKSCEIHIKTTKDKFKKKKNLSLIEVYIFEKLETVVYSVLGQIKNKIRVHYMTNRSEDPDKDELK